MIYLLHTQLLGTKNKPVVRDIEIPADMTLEDLHNAIVQAYGLPGHEMASFYIVNENNELTDEIPLFPIDEESIDMQRVKVGDVLSNPDARLVYIYDFLNMWHFLVELMTELEHEPGALYPRLGFAAGELPDEPPPIHFETIDKNHDTSTETMDEDFEEFGNFFDENDEDVNPDDWY